MNNYVMGVVFIILGISAVIRLIIDLSDFKNRFLNKKTSHISTTT